jgi:hypothetical protein
LILAGNRLQIRHGDVERAREIEREYQGGYESGEVASAHALATTQSEQDGSILDVVIHGSRRADVEDPDCEAE